MKGSIQPSFLAFAAMILLLGSTIATLAHPEEDDKDIGVRHDQTIFYATSNLPNKNWHQFFSVANVMGCAAEGPTCSYLQVVVTTSSASTNALTTLTPTNPSTNAASSPTTLLLRKAAASSTPTALSLMDRALPALVVSLNLLWGSRALIVTQVFQGLLSVTLWSAMWLGKYARESTLVTTSWIHNFNAR